MSGNAGFKLPLRKEAGFRFRTAWLHLHKAGCALRDAVKALFGQEDRYYFDSGAIRATYIMPGTIPAEQIIVSGITTEHLHVTPVDEHIWNNLITPNEKDDDDMPPVTTLGLGDDTTSKKKPAKKKKSPAKKKK